MSRESKTRLEMKTTPNGRTVTHLYYGEEDISDRAQGLSLHINPGDPITAEIVLLIDDVQVSVDVVQNIIEAVLPPDLYRQLPALVPDPDYDEGDDNVNWPRTFG